MVESCSAMNCRNRRTKSVKMKFHRIPKDPIMRKMWLDAIGRVNFTPSLTSVICEKHFNSEDYEVNVHGNKVLKKTAVPTVFDFFAHLKAKPEQRRILKKEFDEPSSEGADQDCNICEVSEVLENKNFEEGGLSKLPNKPISSCEESTSDGADPTSSICEKGENNFPRETLGENICHLRTRRQPVFFGDFEFSDLNDNQCRKRFWKVAHETVNKYKTVNKYNQCKIRRQKEKIMRLENQLKELRKQKKISSTQAFV